jgi:hypothetical protein
MKKIGRLILALMLAAALAGTAQADQFATAILTVTSGAALSIPPNAMIINGRYATQAFGTVEGGSVRLWYSGDTPTSSTGHLVQAGQWFKLENANEVMNFQVIAVSATATVTLTMSW